VSAVAVLTGIELDGDDDEEWERKPLLFLACIKGQGRGTLNLLRAIMVLLTPGV
jgi:hypothetical protein